MPSPSRWALARGARTTWHRYRDGVAALPDGAWGRWLRTLGLGLVVAGCVALGLVAAGRALAQDALRAWDEATLETLVDAGPLSFNGGIWWESPGNSVVLIPLLLAGAVLAARARRPLLALSFPLAYLGSKLLTHIAWTAWGRSRPEFVADGVASMGLHSFPSGHVVNVLGAYGLLAYLWIERSESAAERTLAVAAVLSLAGIVGLARLRLGAHWPSDVVAGLVLGAVWAGVLVVALRRGEALSSPPL